MLDESVRKYLDDHFDRQLEFLCEFLRFPSVANISDPDGCRPCAEWLADYLSTIGFDVSVMEAGGHPCVFGELHVSDDIPTVLIYGHYDVQPPEPLEQWKSDPYGPVVKDGVLYARGASDDKGQLFTHLMAIESYVKTLGKPPVNIKVLFEGEEEIGSPSMESFLLSNREILKADVLVISDNAFAFDEIPSILVGLRGLATFEVTFSGPSHDLHSGLAGGLVTNPVNALAKLVASMHDDQGRVAIPGFYDDVISPTREELQSWETSGFALSDWVESFGVESLSGGESDYSPLERNWSRPTLDCNGITGGYQGNGDKTIIPSMASVKISTRLVPDQSPEKITSSFQQFVRDNAPESIHAEVVCRASARSVLLDISTPAAIAGRNAMSEAFGSEPVLVRCGASIPITELFQRILGLDAVMLGMGLPGDNVHSPNENIPLEQLRRGAVMSALFLGQKLG